MPGFCRDCRRDAPDAAGRCSGCGSPRILRHPEIETLAIAHVDCDAFYATIEKRDDPSLADKPVIVGGRQRGVVLTCCYVARTFGVRSAMPMFEARRLCPHATVVRPDMEKYAARRRARCARSCARSRRWSSRCRSTRRSWISPAPTRLHGMSPGQVARGLRRPTSSTIPRHHGVDRALRQQVPRQDRLRPRQAARLRGARRGRGSAVPGARSR